jgi:hypothetical protein
MNLSMDSKERALYQGSTGRSGIHPLLPQLPRIAFFCSLFIILPAKSTTGRMIRAKVRNCLEADLHASLEFSRRIARRSLSYLTKGGRGKCLVRPNRAQGKIRVVQHIEGLETKSQ